jgi:hypothetical protein
VSPSFFFSAPAKASRMVCCCQPVASTISAMVGPSMRWSMAIIVACFVPSRGVRSFAPAGALGAALGGRRGGRCGLRLLGARGRLWGFCGRLVGRRFRRVFRPLRRLRFHADGRELRRRLARMPAAPAAEMDPDLAGDLASGIYDTRCCQHGVLQSRSDFPLVEQGRADHARG